MVWMTDDDSVKMMAQMKAALVMMVEMIKRVDSKCSAHPRLMESCSCWARNSEMVKLRCLEYCSYSVRNIYSYLHTPKGLQIMINGCQ